MFAYLLITLKYSGTLELELNLFRTQVQVLKSFSFDRIFPIRSNEKPINWFRGPKITTKYDFIYLFIY